MKLRQAALHPLLVRTALEGSQGLFDDDDADGGPLAPADIEDEPGSNDTNIFRKQALEALAAGSGEEQDLECALCFEEMDPPAMHKECGERPVLLSPLSLV